MASLCGQWRPETYDETGVSHFSGFKIYGLTLRKYIETGKLEDSALIETQILLVHADPIIYKYSCINESKISIISKCHHNMHYAYNGAPSATITGITSLKTSKSRRKTPTTIKAIPFWMCHLHQEVLQVNFYPQRLFNGILSTQYHLIHVNWARLVNYDP